MALLTVGTGQGDYATIAAAVAASSPGDTVEIASGTYTNDFVTISHDLTLRAADGASVRLVATVPPPNGKAIIDEGGAGITVTIQGLDISGAAVPDNNGAAVRYEGGTLNLVGDTIHDNQEGLLGAADPGGVIVIDGSTFANNGSGDGVTHNIYAGAIASLTVRNSTVTGALVGHDIKSRAASTEITGNVITDGPGGTASYEIDLPNGGVGVIENNTIEKGANASNPIAISFGEEGGLYASSSLRVANNTIVNHDTSRPTTVVKNADSAVSAAVTGNGLYGWTTVLSGPGQADGNTELSSDPTAACFCRGTLIATEAGERAVETLVPGDVVVTASGRHRPVTWTGSRSYAGRFLVANPGVQPVCFRAGSLGDGLPRRDLRVSPDHAMFLDGVLVPARCLVNGDTIVREGRAAHVAYVHVELDGHDLLLAEGAPTESFADDGSRGVFHATSGHVWNNGRAQPAAFCAPRVGAGPLVDAIRARLSRRVAARCA